MSDEKAEAQNVLQESVVLVGEYAHYKGGLYIVFATSLDEATLKPLVHYYSPEKKTRWTRTVENFRERVNGIPRFRYLRSPTPEELRESLT